MKVALVLLFVLLGVPLAGSSDAIPIVLKEWSVSKPLVENSGDLTFDIKNAGQIPHDFVISDGRTVWLKTTLLIPGKELRISLTLPPGKYTLYCDVPGHREVGMVSSLVVK